MRVRQKYRHALRKAIGEEATRRRVADKRRQREAQLREQAVRVAQMQLRAVFQQGHVRDPKEQHHRQQHMQCGHSRVSWMRYSF